MIFTSKYGQHVKLDGVRQPPKKPMNLYTTRRTVRDQSIPSTTVPRIAPSDGDRMTWGAPTWTFFHVLPEKLSNKNFIKNKDGIIRLITTICNNLPCPYCREHAAAYCKLLIDNKINTKDKLKNELFIFHNNVNKRINKKVFDKTILDKYKNIDIFKAYRLFDKQFYKQYVANHDFQGWKRNRIREKLNNYFYKHWKHMFKV